VHHNSTGTIVAQADSLSFRLRRLLEFAKLMAGHTPVLPDAIIDMSFLLLGHSEIKEQASFMQIQNGNAQNEHVGLMMLTAATDVAPPPLGGSDEDEEKRKDKEKEHKAQTERVGRMNDALRALVDRITTSLERVSTFDEALLTLFTPYGASAVLTSWHFLQKSSKLYGKRSLAQLIVNSSLPLRTMFARFCANQYCDTDKMRPTRHAHGIDFANDINVKHTAMSKFFLRSVEWNPRVRDAEDMREDPWVIVK
jgi:hypothetical protein